MPSSSVTALAGLRTAVGVGAWATPNVAGRMFGLDPDANPQASYLGRLFGVRDIALGAGALTSEGADRRRWVQLGIACDLADAAAGFIALRTGVLPKPAAIMVTGVALVAAGMGAAALASENGEDAISAPAAADVPAAPIPA
jgi:hypothetical protein